MNGSLAAWLRSWSRQTPTKSRYMSSTTGRMPGHRRADAEAHDRRLRDRRVAHPVAEPVVQAAGEAEDVAAVADVDAGDEHPLVGRRARPRARRGWRPSCGRPARPPATAPARAASGRVADHEVEQRSTASGSAARGRPRRRASSSRVDRRLERRDRRRRRRPASRRRAACTSERIALAATRCSSSAVAVALRVALVVAVPAVGGGLDDDRAAAGPHAVDHRRPSAAAVATTSLPSTATWAHAVAGGPLARATPACWSAAGENSA